MRTIDLNSDMGESYGNYQYGDDKRMLQYITSANLACGFHGGDPLVMQETVRLAKECGVQVGAHPGLPDRLGFGRRYMQVSPKEVYSYIVYQLGALEGFLRAEQMPLSHLKLHGALYMMALKDASVAEAVAEALYGFDPQIPVYTIAGTAMHRAAQRLGLTVVPEYFADRPYTEAGVKMFGWTQDEIGSPKEIALRVVQLLETGHVNGLSNASVPVECKTICVHSDTPNAGNIIKEIREALENRQVAVLQHG